MGPIASLPPEILCIVLRELDEQDLASCSGADPRWHPLVQWEMQRRGKTFYRWPYSPGARVGKNLCIAGDVRSLKAAASLYRGAENLEIYIDVPCGIHERLMSQIIQPHTTSLVLSNLTVDVDCVKVILNSNVISLKIFVKHRRDISRKAKKFLLDHKELFEILIMYYEKPTKTFMGIFPNPRRPIKLKTLPGKRVTLDATGLHTFPLTNKGIVELKLLNAFYISGEELNAISKLPLREFSISDCNISPDEFLRALETGFDSVKSLTILNCNCVNLETVRYISQILSLENLFLDLRNVDEIEQSLNFLNELVNLKLLIVLYSSDCNFKNVVLLNKKSKCLKYIIFKNYQYCSMSEVDFPIFNKKAKLLDIHFQYINERTRIRSSHSFQKLCKC